MFSLIRNLVPEKRCFKGIDTPNPFHFEVLTRFPWVNKTGVSPDGEYGITETIRLMLREGKPIHGFKIPRDRSRKQEKEAKVFAAYFLFPEEKLNRVLEEEWVKESVDPIQS